MSDIREVDFFCPHCRARNKAALHTRVEARDEPDLARQLLAGTLSEVTCWQCRERTPLEHSVVYVDADRKSAIWLDPNGDPLAMGSDPEDGEAMRLRRVRDANALRELAAIWRDELDDEAMLLLKHMLAARMLEETGSAPLLCAYEDRFNMENGEWLEYVVFTCEEGDPEALRTPLSTYKSVADALEMNRERLSSVFPPGEWVDWDENAARKLWEGMQER